MRHTLTILTLITVLAACGTSDPARARILPSPAQRAVVSPEQTGASKPLELHAFRVSVPAAGGAVVRDVLMAREAGEGTFWWMTMETTGNAAAVLELFPGRNVTLYTGAGRIALVIPLSRTAFQVRASARRAASADEAKAMIAAELERNPEGPLRTVVELMTHLGRDWGRSPGEASTLPPLTIQHVGYENGRWSIVVKGLNGDVAEVTLDDDHRILEVTRRQS